jgi:hypothetical protein
MQARRAAGNQRTNRRAAEENEPSLQEEMMRTMVKLTLSSSQSVRATEGCLYTMYLVPETAPPMVEARRALPEYCEDIEGKPRRGRRMEV